MLRIKEQNNETLECDNLENGNWFTEKSIINYYKNDPKKSSRLNFHHQMHTQTI